MARVSQAHLDARRRQILDGAVRCFARNGFHATSMQDVLRESGLSAGAVYRYFASKDEIIRAIAEEVVGTIRSAYAEAAATTPRPTPDVLLATVRDRVFHMSAGGDDPLVSTRLILQVWAETPRNEDLAAALRAGFAALHELWAGLVHDYQQDGQLPAEVPAADIARVLIATAQGLIAQQALFGDVDTDTVRAALRAVLRPTTPPR
ncbi:TetR/AcrR family transcriptional regulator [Kitasatospora sp. NPDC096147]|uniref:TetR/AcrR family transcriptional regulator n=1 Tax=Kitasatospora sp. NPDC096147 TaxID=3364093 RepID=UPI00380F6348